MSALQRRTGHVGVVVLLMVEMLSLIVACGSQAATGKTLFEDTYRIAQVSNCRSCHAVIADDDSTTTLGPNLSGIATHAATRVPGMTAYDYLVESIIAPDAYVVAGYEPGLMPHTYRVALSDDQVDALVAYLLTLNE